MGKNDVFCFYNKVDVVMMLLVGYWYGGWF